MAAAAANLFGSMRHLSPRRGPATVLGVAVLVLVVTAAGPSRAQVLPLPAEPTTTTGAAPPTTSSSTTSSSTTVRPALLPPPGARPSPTSSSTTTTTTTKATTTTTAPAHDPSQPGDGAAPPDAGAFPPELAALSNSVRRTPAGSTTLLLAELAPLARYGLDATQRAVLGFGRFPVAGEAHWSDDWWYPRFGPNWRLHEGLDIFAAYGTPLRAPVDGTVRIRTGGLGGLAVYVTGTDHTYWYLAHLSAVAEGLVEGATVVTGQVVGYVGDSGNASGGAPHLHFEVHPRGGGPVPPKPIVDQFVLDARRLVVPHLLAAYAARGVVAVAPTTPAPTLPDPPVRRARAAAVSPSMPVGMVRLAAVSAATTLGWSVLARPARRGRKRGRADVRA